MLITDLFEFILCFLVLLVSEFLFVFFVAPLG